MAERCSSSRWSQCTMFMELATYESVQTVVMENGSTRLWSQNSRDGKAET